MTKAASFLAAVVAMATGAGGCSAPDDGVLSVAFQLEPPPPSELRVLPPQERVGVAPLAFGQAHGRCDADPPARRMRCTFDALPQPLAPEGEALVYDLAFLIEYAPLPARYDGRLVDRDPGGRDPDAPPPPPVVPLPRRSVGAVRPDPLGKADRTITDPAFPFDRVAGAELTLAVSPTGGAPPARYVVIDGRVGNLTASGAAAEPVPQPASSGHHH